MKRYITALGVVFLLMALIPATAMAVESDAPAGESGSALTELAEPTGSDWVYNIEIVWGDGVEPRPVHVRFLDTGFTFSDSTGWTFGTNASWKSATEETIAEIQPFECRSLWGYIDKTGQVKVLTREDGRFDVSYDTVVDQKSKTVTTTVTNSYKDANLVSVPITIVWNDNDNADGMRFDSVSLGITMNGLWTPNTISLSEEDGWSGVLDDWEALDESGEPITYAVAFGDNAYTRAHGYTSAVSGNMQSGYTVEFTYDPSLVDEDIIAQGPLPGGKGGTSTSGWLRFGESWRYASDGILLTGWQKVKGSWYLLKDSGVDVGRMLTGWQKVGGTWYFLADSGKMRTGWFKDADDSWYYLKTSGAMATGWQEVNHAWYFMDKSGKMRTGWVKSNEKWYLLGPSGAMRTGWVMVDDAWYYLDKKSGAMAAGTWVGNYYVQKNGNMATNAWIGRYHVGADGKWDKTR